MTSNGAAVSFAKRLGRIQLGKQFWQDSGEAIEAGILDNIAKQKTADGGALKRNAPKTIERKLLLGRGIRSLVDEKHRFVQGAQGSYKIKLIGGMFGKATGVSVIARDWPRRIGGYLEDKGYTGWFGISQKALALIRRLLRLEVKRVVAKAAREASK